MTTAIFSHDLYTTYLCGECKDWIDFRREELIPTDRVCTCGSTFLVELTDDDIETNIMASELEGNGIEGARDAWAERVIANAELAHVNAIPVNVLFDAEREALSRWEAQS